MLWFGILIIFAFLVIPQIGGIDNEQDQYQQQQQMNKGDPLSLLSKNNIYNQISYNDLKEASVQYKEFCESRDPQSILRPAKNSQQIHELLTQQKTIEQFKAQIYKYYNKSLKKEISLNQMINLVQNGVIHSQQGIMIWEYLRNKQQFTEQQQQQQQQQQSSSIQEIPINYNYKYNNNNNNNDNNNQANKNKNNLMDSGDVNVLKEILNFCQGVLGQFILNLLLILGYLIFMFLYLVIFYVLYQRRYYATLLVAQIILGLNIYTFADYILTTYHSYFFSSLFYVSYSIIYHMVTHIILCILHLHEQIKDITEIFGVDNFNGKLIHVTLQLFFNYFLAYRCPYFITQIPFYLSLYWLIYLISAKYINYFPNRMQPTWIFGLSIAAFLQLFYFNETQQNSFKLQLITQLLDNQYFFNLRNYYSQVDFRFSGYLLIMTIISLVFPVYLFTQHQGVGSSFKYNQITFKELLNKFKELLAEDEYQQKFPRDIWITIYCFSVLVTLQFALKNKIIVMIVPSIIGVQSFLGILAKDQRILPAIFFYLIGFYILNATHLIGKIHDEFQEQVLDFGKNGNLFFFGILFFVKILLNYYCLEICSASIIRYKTENQVENGQHQDIYENSNKNDLTKILDTIHFIIKILINYVFAVYLLTLSENEENFLMNLMYSFSAITFFARILINTKFPTDEINRILLSLSIYLIGLRITFLSIRSTPTFYFGAIVVNSSVFSIYIAIKSITTSIISIVMLGGIFCQAVMLHSKVLMIIAIINTCLFIISIIEDKTTRMKLLLVLVISNFLICIIDKFSFEIYFKYFQILMQSLFNNNLITFSDELSIENILPEQVLTKHIYEFILYYIT